MMNSRIYHFSRLRKQIIPALFVLLVFISFVMSVREMLAVDIYSDYYSSGELESLAKIVFLFPE
ncbi:hypothetical protein [Anabaena sp. FACHB-83]|uniref:hypothetical protein n=1 Tax=Anabaena sp. FACHB-83 TaxID=2692772 RepID=UPI001A7E2014|nr:hypothetical protein [Anabaena sp. FACHB-83]